MGRWTAVHIFNGKLISSSEDKNIVVHDVIAYLKENKVVSPTSIKIEFTTELTSPDVEGEVSSEFTEHEQLRERVKQLEEENKELREEVEDLEERLDTMRSFYSNT